MSAEQEVSMAFMAIHEGPPKRIMYICKELPLPNDAPPEMVSGWTFNVDEADETGRMQPLRDTWEATYEEIIRYPELYAPREIQWVNFFTSEPVDIYGL